VQSESHLSNGSEKCASIRVIFLENSEEVIITWGNPIARGPDCGIQPALE